MVFAVNESDEDFEACGEASGSDNGYVSVDAMVALLIISLSVILSLQAVRTAHQVSTAANEYKSAQIVMSYLMETGPRSFTETSGVTDGFAWRLVTQTTGFARPVALCHRGLSLTALRSSRTYAAATQEVCPPDSAT